MSKKRDYYDVLQLSKSATQQDIKKSFRKLAMKYHPDVNKGDASAEEKFKEINEAYEVLSDPEKRSQYDRFGHGGVKFNSAGGSGGGFQGGFEDLFNSFGAGFGSIFEEFFSNTTGTAGRGPGGAMKGQDIINEVNITHKEAYYGKVINLTMPNGSIKKFSIPEGVRDGVDLRLADQGKPGINGGPNGDYYIRIKVMEHKSIERVQDDLIYTIDLNLFDIITGVKVEFDLFGEEKIKINVPELSSPDQILRVKGRGFSNMRMIDKRGDLYVKLNPIMPKKLTKKSRDALEILKRETRK